MNGTINDVNDLFDAISNIIGKDELRQCIEHIYENLYG
jgi:hypothetical protein